MPEDKPIINEGEEGQFTFLDPEENYYPAASDYTRIPNRFVERYGNISYLANMGLMMAINRVEERKKELYANTMEGMFFKEVARLSGTDFSDGLVAEFPISEFIKIFDLNTGGRIYNQIDSLYNGELLRNQWQILYEDENIVASSAVIIGTMYNKKNKHMYLKFHPDLAPIITNIKTDYATIPLPVIGKLKDDFISQLYQVLKKRLDYEMSRNKKYGMAIRKEVKATFSIDQFLFMMGIFPLDLSSEDSDMQKVVQFLKSKDYEMAGKIERESGLLDRYGNSDNGGNSKKLAITRFAHFRDRYLDKAFRRINGFSKPKLLDKLGSDPSGAAYEEYCENCKTKHPTDIHFRYELIKSSHGKVSSISFYISKADWSEQTDTEEAAINPVVDELEFILEMKDIIREKVTAQEIRAIAEAAKWDINRIRKAYMVAGEQAQAPDDITAFMIAAINGNWEPHKVEVPEAEETIHRYSSEEVKKKLRFDKVCREYLDEDSSEEEDTLEVFMQVITEFLNSDEKTIKINRTTMQAEDVKQKIMQLGNEEIAFAVKSFLAAKPKSVSDKYIITVLFNADKQRDLNVAQKAAQRKAKKENPVEEYPREFIDKQLHYRDVMLMAEGCESVVDSVFNIIYDTLNNTAERVKIGKGEMPASAVKSRLLKLNAFDTVTAIKKIIDSGHSDIVTPAYVLTILYTIHDQENLALNKDLAEGGYLEGFGMRKGEKKEGKAVEDDTEDYVPETTNKFNQFHQTKYSKDDYDDFEFKKLME